MSRPIIYVAGPFRGPTPWHVECNVRKAEEAGLLIAKLGAVPLIPHTLYRHFDKSLPDEFWLDATRELLEHCNALVLLPRWQRSVGSAAEYAHSVEMKIPSFEIYDGWEALAEFVQGWDLQ